MVDLLTDLLTDAEGLIILAIGVAAIWFTAWTWVRTRSVVPTLTSLILGAAVIWGVSNYDLLRDNVGEDVDRYEAPGHPAGPVGPVVGG